MKEKESKLIKDLFAHFDPKTEVTQELINSCYENYGSIRGILMNIILKFQPNADVSDEYLDKKLASYGLMNSENVSNSTTNSDEEQKVTQDASQSLTQHPPKSTSDSAQQLNQDTSQSKPQPNEVGSKSSSPTDNKKPVPNHKSSKKKIFIILGLVIGFVAVGFLFQDNIKNMFKSEKDVLISGTAIVNLNLRATPSVPNTEDGEIPNIVGTLDPGDIVNIVSFNPNFTGRGVYWCEVKLISSVFYNGQELNYAWVAYKAKELPYISSNDSWVNIKKMYQMQYENDFSKVLKKAKTWFHQSIYDYVYSDKLYDIKTIYDLSISSQGEETPRFTLDFTNENHSQFCALRITTATTNVEEKEKIYGVFFNETPRSINFFRMNKNNNRGEYLKGYDLSNSLNSNIKSIERHKKNRRVYILDDWTLEKSKLKLNYDAVRLKLYGERDSYILYNTSEYTNPTMDNADIYISKEY